MRINFVTKRTSRRVQGQGSPARAPTPATASHPTPTPAPSPRASVLPHTILYYMYFPFWLRGLSRHRHLILMSYSTYSLVYMFDDAFIAVACFIFLYFIFAHSADVVLFLLLLLSCLVLSAR